MVPPFGRPAREPSGRRLRLHVSLPAACGFPGPRVSRLGALCALDATRRGGSSEWSCRRCASATALDASLVDLDVVVARDGGRPPLLELVAEGAHAGRLVGSDVGVARNRRLAREERVVGDDDDRAGDGERRGGGGGDVPEAETHRGGGGDGVERHVGLLVGVMAGTPRTVDGRGYTALAARSHFV